jgi:DNA processing protein
MTAQDLFYLLALQKIEGVGDIVAKKLINHLGSAEAVFSNNAKHISNIDGVGSVLIQKLKDKTVFAKAEAEIKFIEENHIKVHFFQDSDYPERLKHCIDSPILLFSSGNIDLENRKIISIVGTRQCTAYGNDFCKKLIADLAPLNPIIVSGFALGIDIIAHQTAMEHDLQTIGVLAHGLNQIYPKSHKKFVAKMEQDGGFFTEFWSISEIASESFVKRNRIVAGIAEATIVIESAEKGGSLITATLASEYDREVFAVPGRATDKYSQGCNSLIKSEKARLLTSAADLIYHLNWDIETPSKPIQKQLFVTLDADEQKLYDYLQVNGKQLLDIISLECHIPVSKLSGTLHSMELKGVVRPLPGKQFEAI